MTVLIYVERAKPVGDLSASRSLRKPTPREVSFAENDPEGWLLSMN